MRTGNNKTRQKAIPSILIPERFPKKTRLDVGDTRSLKNYQCNTQLQITTPSSQLQLAIATRNSTTRILPTKNSYFTWTVQFVNLTIVAVYMTIYMTIYLYISQLSNIVK